MAEQLERRSDRAPARFGGLDYAPAPEATDHVNLRADHGLLIGGRWVEPASGKRFKTINPATEEVLAEVAEAGEEDVDAAVKAARAAYTRTWSRMSGAERAKYLYRMGRDPPGRGRGGAGAGAEVLCADARLHQGGGRRVGRVGCDERRKADQGVPRRRRAPGRGPLL